MLNIEKALQDIRGLQDELAAIGVHIELEESKDGAVAYITAPCLHREDEQYICPDGNFHDGLGWYQIVPFYEYRRRLCVYLARYYEGEAEVIADKWSELCGGKPLPLPDSLKARKESLADTAVKLRDLIKDVPPKLTAQEYKTLAHHLLCEHLCEMRDMSGPLMQDKNEFEVLSNLGLVRYSGVGLSVEVTRLGKKAVRQYENEKRD